MENASLSIFSLQFPQTLKDVGWNFEEAAAVAWRADAHGVGNLPDPMNGESY